MWFLDPTNSPELINRLQPHARRFMLEAMWVGEGWRRLVEDCHERLVVQFPDYELLAIKQKYGFLAFQAFPRPAARGEHRWTPKEAHMLDRITDEFRVQSESVWNGAAARVSADRRAG